MPKVLSPPVVSIAGPKNNIYAAKLVHSVNIRVQPSAGDSRIICFRTFFPSVDLLTTCLCKYLVYFCSTHNLPLPVSVRLANLGSKNHVRPVLSHLPIRPHGRVNLLLNLSAPSPNY